MKLPKAKDLKRLLIALKPMICDEDRADEGDTIPSRLVTIGADIGGNWGYQTGDNSYSGGAYGYPHWAVITLCRRSNTRELVRDIRAQLADLMEG